MARRPTTTYRRATFVVYPVHDRQLVDLIARLSAVAEAPVSRSEVMRRALTEYYKIIMGQPSAG